MRWSQTFVYTSKDNPADAEIPSHQLLVRGGFIKKLAPGIFTYGPLLLRSLRKFENIIREELNSISGIEILMPMVQPKDIWEETGRWEKMAETGLLRFKNRNQHDFCLGATHEEAVTDFVRSGVKSYRDLPKIIFQIQTKFRDEIRPRFGLMRGREFLMKDAYSFDLDKESALLSYDKLFAAYKAIFSRLGADFVVVDADSGSIGGDKSQEFHILAESGEDRLLVSEDRTFAANAEVCPVFSPGAISQAPIPEDMEEFATPGLKKISSLSKALNIPEMDLVKIIFLNGTDSGEELKPVAVLLRGGDELNPIKLKNEIGLTNPPQMLSDKEVSQVSGAYPGSCGPVGLDFPVYMDQSLEGKTNFIVGANKNGFHLKNVNVGRDFKPTKIGDYRFATAGDKVPGGAGELQEIRGIEVGHIFYLGSVYSDKMGAKYLDSDKQSKSIEMGCYGIGVSRTVQAIIEQCHDKDGIIWPVAIAPFTVHICLLDPDKKEVSDWAEKFYSELGDAGVDCFLDDRDERPGVKFKDADLLGMPFRIVVGGRGVSGDEVEIVVRKTKETIKVPLGEVVSKIRSLV